MATGNFGRCLGHKTGSKRRQIIVRGRKPACYLVESARAGYRIGRSRENCELHFMIHCHDNEKEKRLSLIITKTMLAINSDASNQEWLIYKLKSVIYQHVSFNSIEE